MRKAKPGIYKALGADGFELCHPVDKEDYERINVEIGGTPQQASWKPIPVRLIREDEGKALTMSDSPSTLQRAEVESHGLRVGITRTQLHTGERLRALARAFALAFANRIVDGATRSERAEDKLLARSKRKVSWPCERLHHLEDLALLNTEAEKLEATPLRKSLHGFFLGRGHARIGTETPQSVARFLPLELRIRTSDENAESPGFAQHAP